VQYSDFPPRAGWGHQHRLTKRRMLPLVATVGTPR
jgi:hypothetical protein